MLSTQGFNHFQGTLRVLLVLLHDFPEFLCDYHYAFCDVIPPNCIQMRNLILSAFPRNMRLPDPFTPNLKVDMLADIAHPPRILTNFANMIQPMSFKKVTYFYLHSNTYPCHYQLMSIINTTRYHFQLSGYSRTDFQSQFILSHLKQWIFFVHVNTSCLFSKVWSRLVI